MCVHVCVSVSVCVLIWLKLAAVKRDVIIYARLWLPGATKGVCCPFHRKAGLSCLFTIPCECMCVCEWRLAFLIRLILHLTSTSVHLE